jgi:hypothetical protein
MSASNIKLRRSAIPGKIPTVEQLDLGEFAVNTYDGRLYTKKNVSGTESIVTFTGLSTETNVYVDTFVADGLTDTFTLSRIPVNEESVFVTINGVSQHVSVYSISGNVLEFVETPLNLDDIEVRILDFVSAATIIRDYESYVYTANNETTFSGPDNNGKTLEYDLEKLEVYANGVRLVNTLDYTAATGTSVVTLEPFSGTIEIVSLAKTTFVDNTQIKPVKTNLTTTSSNQIVDTFDASIYRTAKYLIQATANTSYHATELLLIHDNTNTYTTEYATITTGANLMTLDSDISGGLVRLLVTPANINTNIRIQRISVTST